MHCNLQFTRQGEVVKVSGEGFCRWICTKQVPNSVKGGSMEGVKTSASHCLAPSTIHRLQVEDHLGHQLTVDESFCFHQPSSGGQIIIVITIDVKWLHRRLAKTSHDGLCVVVHIIWFLVSVTKNESEKEKMTFWIWDENIWTLHLYILRNASTLWDWPCPSSEPRLKRMRIKLFSICCEY